MTWAGVRPRAAAACSTQRTPRGSQSRRIVLASQASSCCSRRKAIAQVWSPITRTTAASTAPARGSQSLSLETATGVGRWVRVRGCLRVSATRRAPARPSATSVAASWGWASFRRCAAGRWPFRTSTHALTNLRTASFASPDTPATIVLFTGAGATGGGFLLVGLDQSRASWPGEEDQESGSRSSSNGGSQRGAGRSLIAGLGPCLATSTVDIAHLANRCVCLRLLVTASLARDLESRQRAVRGLWITPWGDAPLSRAAIGTSPSCGTPWPAWGDRPGRPCRLASGAPTGKARGG
jgi:hypothetical protein